MSRRKPVNLCKCGCGALVSGVWKRGHATGYRLTHGNNRWGKWDQWSLEEDALIQKQAESGVTYLRLRVPNRTIQAVRQRYRVLGVRCVKKAPTGWPGKGMSAPHATERPTLKDIYWAAGFFDGEGCSALAVDKRSKGSNGSNIANVDQKDPELLYKMQQLFGGSIGSRVSRSVIRGKTYDCPIHRWQISGPRARGFLMTIYSLLSMRRQGQIRRTLQVAA